MSTKNARTTRRSFIGKAAALIGAPYFIPAKVLGADAKFDGKDERAIKSEVIAKVKPAIKLDGKSDDYVSAMFDACLDTTAQGSTIQGFHTALSAIKLDAVEPGADDKSPKRGDGYKQPLAMTKGK